MKIRNILALSSAVVAMGAVPALATDGNRAVMEHMAFADGSSVSFLETDQMSVHIDLMGSASPRAMSVAIDYNIDLLDVAFGAKTKLMFEQAYVEMADIVDREMLDVRSSGAFFGALKSAHRQTVSWLESGMQRMTSGWTEVMSVGRRTSLA